MSPQRILDELLNTEFQNVKQKYGRITIKWEIPTEKSSFLTRLLKVLGIKKKYNFKQTSAWVVYFPAWEVYEPVIYLNKSIKSRLLADQEVLRELLRHECLHLSLGEKRGVKEFNKQARKRKILPER